MNELILILAIILIASLLTDAYFHAKKGEIEKQLIEIYREEIKVNRELNDSISKLRKELIFNSRNIPIPDLLKVNSMTMGNQRKKESNG